MPGGQQTQKTTTTIVPTPEQTEVAQLGIDKIKGFEAPAQQVAPFNPLQLLSQGAAVGSAIPQAQLASAGQGATNFLLGPALFPETNPALQATIDAANTASNRNFNWNVLPGIRADAVGTGNYGGSRQGIAEGIAGAAAQRDASDRAAAISTAGYQSGLQALLGGLNLLPQTQLAQSTPAGTLASVGDVQQGQTQAQLDTNYLNQMFPWLQGLDLIGASSGIPGGSTTVEQPMPRKSLLSSILGGASLAAGIPGIGIPGMIIGGLLGGVSSFF